MLWQARLRDFTQLDDLVPNVQFNQGGQLGNIFITIRGVESNPFIVNRAAVYIDGIPFRELTNAVLSQVDSIEVLRGPQGTLYGANSESGLIVIRTRLPSDAPESAHLCQYVQAERMAANGKSKSGRECPRCRRLLA